MDGFLKKPSYKKLVLTKYMGGKYYMAKNIISLFTEHYCYVEVFGGGGHVLLQKPKSTVEVLNDLDEVIYTVWKTIKEKGDLVKKELEDYIVSRKIYEELKAEWFSGNRGKNDVEITCRFLYLCNNSFSGIIDSDFSSSPLRNKACSFFGRVSIISLIKNRLKNVVIENLDFRECIRKYDTEETLFYLDPPYYNKNYYMTNFTIKDHEDLAEILNNIKGKFVLSYYTYDRIEEFYPKNKFRYFFFNVFKHSTFSKYARPTATEVVITNYEPIKQKKLYEN